MRAKINLCPNFFLTLLPLENKWLLKWSRRAKKKSLSRREKDSAEFFPSFFSLYFRSLLLLLGSFADTACAGLTHPASDRHLHDCLTGDSQVKSPQDKRWMAGVRRGRHEEEGERGIGQEINGWRFSFDANWLNIAVSQEKRVFDGEKEERRKCTACAEKPEMKIAYFSQDIHTLQYTLSACFSLRVSWCMLNWHVVCSTIKRIEPKRKWHVAPDCVWVWVCLG